MSDEKYTKEEQEAYDEAQRRREIFENSNAIERAIWNSKDRSGYTDEQNEAYNQGLKDAKK